MLPAAAILYFIAPFLSPSSLVASDEHFPSRMQPFYKSNVSWTRIKVLIE